MNQSLLAAIVFDQFHVVKLVNEKLDDLRREMVREATDLVKKTVKGIRYLLLMRRDNVRAEKLPRLDEALKHNEPLLTCLLLFDRIIIESPRLQEVPALVNEIGLDAVKLLLKSGAIDFRCKTGTFCESNPKAI
jgi:hypothetical protein